MKCMKESILMLEVLSVVKGWSRDFVELYTSRTNIFGIIIIRENKNSPQLNYNNKIIRCLTL